MQRMATICSNSNIKGVPVMNLLYVLPETLGIFSNNNKGDTKCRVFAVLNKNHMTAMITNFHAGQLK